MAFFVSILLLLPLSSPCILATGPHSWNGHLSSRYQLPQALFHDAERIHNMGRSPNSVFLRGEGGGGEGAAAAAAAVVTHSSEQSLEIALEQDAKILLALKEGLSSDPFGALNDWGTSTDPCSWSGVGCEHDATTRSRRVVSLEIDGEMLEGTISPVIGSLSELQKIVLEGNRLSGPIPKEVGALRKLAVLDLRSNRLSGAIPEDLSRLERLEELNLSDNFLSGTIFSMNPPFHQLRVLNLSRNYLTGRVPPQLGACSSLEELHLSSNELVGIIPPSFGSLANLLSLALNDNLLDGGLPMSLGGCNKLQFLDVADNFLNGRIPSSLAQLSGLRLLNVSNNQLEGPIPSGQWFRYGIQLDSLSGNPQLCGWPLEPCDSAAAPAPSATPTWASGFSALFSKAFKFFIPRTVSRRVGVSQRFRRGRLLAGNTLGKTPPVAHTPDSSPAPAPAPAIVPYQSNDHKKKKPAERWLLGLAAGMCAGGVTAFVASLVARAVLNYIRRPKLAGPIIYQHKLIKSKDLAFLGKEDGLGGAELIGEGGAGQVFKLTLENGKVVAIKKVIPIVNTSTTAVDANLEASYDLTRNTKQIQAELNTLGHVRHRNLVPLVAYVQKPDSHLLIYDYMVNGSLHEAMRRVADGTLELTWPMRHKIAVGTALGLSYLHFDCTPRIVHRDLKPGNILLDEDFEAHIGDFGVAKVLPDSFTHFTSTNVAGTVGFIAPEYHQTLRFTEKGDVYSFGVVLAVLLTGKEPTDDMFRDVYTNMGRWMYDRLKSDNAVECFDPKLRGQGFEEEMLLALKIAVFCTDESASKRPSSKDALSMLYQIRQV